VITHEYSDESTSLWQLHFGGDRNFCYLLGDRLTGEAAAFDPGFNAEAFKATASEHGLEIKKILITHAHADHLGQALELARNTGASLHAGKGEKMPGAVVLHDGDRIPLGERSIVVVSTPGHSAGHVCFLFEKILITGDLLFCGKVGGTGTYFPGSSAEAEWNSLQRVLELPDDIRVYPGHDYYGGEGKMLFSTIGYERQNNPFLVCKSFEAFRRLKENWEAYKAEHGIR
jgi:hydroxyacylglutathione hydrolase